MLLSGSAAANRPQQDDPGTPDMLLRAVPIRHHRCQTDTVGGVYLNDDAFAHRSDPHAISVPTTEPRGPKRLVPPMTTEAMASNSRRLLASGSAYHLRTATRTGAGAEPVHIGATLRRRGNRRSRACLFNEASLAVVL
jgi:hypothetical protein